MTATIVAVLSLAVSIFLAAARFEEWRRGRCAARQADYEAHTMAGAKSESLSVATLLTVLAEVKAHDAAMTARVAQLEAEVLAHRARLETTQ